MGVEVFRLQEAHIVAGDHRQPALAGGLQGELVEGFFAVAAGAGQFQVQAIAEHALPVGELLLGQVMAAVTGQAPGEAVAAGQCKQVVAAGLEPVGVDGDAAFGAVAFHPGAGEQPGEAEVAFAVAAEQGHAPGRHAFFGDHDVGAGDGLDAHGFGGFVELDQREQVVEIRHCQCGQFQFDRAAEQVGLLCFFRVSLIRLRRDTDGRIRQRKFGVDVEMYETGSGHAEPM